VTWITIFAPGFARDGLYPCFVSLRARSIYRDISSLRARDNVWIPFHTSFISTSTGLCMRLTQLAPTRKSPFSVVRYLGAFPPDTEHVHDGYKLAPRS
jgi:hypothetical protein